MILTFCFEGKRTSTIDKLLELELLVWKYPFFDGSYLRI